MPYTTRRLGWRPDSPDQRDYVYSAPLIQLKTLPTKVDLTPQCPAVYDQGNIGSCTANAAAGLLEFDQMRQKLPMYVPSRLFIYYTTRSLEGTVSLDAGASLRDTCKAIHQYGYCNETQWVYDTALFANRPLAPDYTEALNNRAITYSRITQSLQQMRGCLASGLPFLFGITVYESFMMQHVANSGMVPLPAATEAVVGGHALVAVGYSDAVQRFIFRNSWGDWGLKGYGTIPYAYLTDHSLAADCWTISHVIG